MYNIQTLIIIVTSHQKKSILYGLYISDQLLLELGKILLVIMVILFNQNEVFCTIYKDNLAEILANFDLKCRSGFIEISHSPFGFGIVNIKCFNLFEISGFAGDMALVY